MATPSPVTDTLARFVAETAYSTISERALTNAKMHILDTLGVALVGVSTDAPRIALEYCKRFGDSQESAIWGTRQKSSTPMAAFANGLWPTPSITTTGNPSSMPVTRAAWSSAPRSASAKTSAHPART